MADQSPDARAFFWLGPGSGTAGRDLRRAVEEGVILPSDYARSVDGCRSCGNPDTCRAWLAANDPHRPAACRNAPLIAELRAD